jgi:NADPH:quinone reductase-like Zn-dependent oxidoreductase
MKSVQIKGYGSSDVVQINETASVPSISAGKILVNVKASGVNPVDWKIREGYMQQMDPFNSHQLWEWIFQVLSNR